MLTNSINVVNSGNLTLRGSKDYYSKRADSEERNTMKLSLSIIENQLSRENGFYSKHWRELAPRLQVSAAEMEVHGRWGGNSRLTREKHS
jgi:hypothetical protein